MREGPRVEIFKDGKHMVISGSGASKKLYLATDPRGLFEAPVVTRRRSSAFQKGSTYQGKSYDQRDITFGVHLKGETPEEWQSLHNEWHSMWDYENDPWDLDSTLTKLSITTPTAGTRSLWLALSDTVPSEYEHAPHLTRSSLEKMAVVADQPLYFEDAYENTPVDYFETSSAGTSEGWVTISNPCDQPMWLQWVVTRGVWTLPDYSWVGKKHQRIPGGEHANRKITLPGLGDVEGGARVTLYRDKLQVRDLFGTNLAGRMNGIAFLHRVPPKTPETNLPVKVEAAPAGGGRVEVYCQRRWSHPWLNG